MSSYIALHLSVFFGARFFWDAFILIVFVQSRRQHSTILSQQLFFIRLYSCISSFSLTHPLLRKVANTYVRNSVLAPLCTPILLYKGISGAYLLFYIEEGINQEKKSDSLAIDLCHNLVWQRSATFRNRVQILDV